LLLLHGTVHDWLEGFQALLLLLDCLDDDVLFYARNGLCKGSFILKRRLEYFDLLWDHHYLLETLGLRQITIDFNFLL